MLKSHLAALERCFAAEVKSALTKTLPMVQSKAKAFRELAGDGLIQFVEHRDVYHGLPMVTSGYVLTLAGHMAYCMSCEGDANA